MATQRHTEDVNILPFALCLSHDMKSMRKGNAFALKQAQPFTFRTVRQKVGCLLGQRLPCILYVSLLVRFKSSLVGNKNQQIINIAYILKWIVSFKINI